MKHLKIGVRAHDFGKTDLASLPAMVKEAGFDSVQLALTKSFDIPARAGTLSKEYANNVRKAFDNEGVQIAVLGCYIDPINQDEEKRRNDVDRFCEYLSFAKDFGCPIVATETGKSTIDNREDNYRIILKSIEKMAEAAQTHGVMACIEGVYRHTINTPKQMKRLLDDIKCQNLKVLFDAVNYLNYENHESFEDIIDEAFYLFGDEIQAVHIKDFIPVYSKEHEDYILKREEVGLGRMSYSKILKFVTQKPNINMIVEEYEPKQACNGLNYLRSFL